MSAAIRPIFYWPMRLPVEFYRRVISPRKGFRFAHHALHSEGSCSDYFLEQLPVSEFGELFSKMKLRFQACKAASLHIRNQLHSSDAPSPSGKPNGYGRKECACDGAAALAECGAPLCWPS